MAFMELTYALDRYAGVARGTSSVCFSFPSGLGDVSDWASGRVVGVTRPLVAERDDRYALAWYRKFNLCMISLFGIL